MAVDVSLWLNKDSAALQAVVGCYGLLAPLIFHQIYAEPVVQVTLEHTPGTPHLEHQHLDHPTLNP